MTTINAITFAAHLGADLETEFDTLETLLDACNAGEDKADELKKQYTHISSFLQGVDYMINYITSEDAKAELQDLSETTWHAMLQSYWHAVMSICWTKKLGKKVRIITICMADGEKAYEVKIGDGEARQRVATQRQVVDLLKAA